MKPRRRKLHKPWKSPTRWAIFGLVAGVVIATVGSIGAMNGWFGGGGTVPTDTLTRGLVGYWGFEEGSGTKAADASGNSNHGTLKYMTTGTDAWTKGKVGGALSFDGSDDYVNAGAGASLDAVWTSFTVEAWIKSNELTPASRRAMVSKGTESGNNNFDINLETNGTIRFWFGSSSNLAYSASPIGTSWQHIVGIWNGTQVLVYLNGNAGSAVANTPTVTASGSPVLIGSWDAQATWWFNGLIDEVRIYNRALSAEEVRYHYNRGGPVAQWKFDEGEGRTAYDSTDNNNDGTLVLAGSATSSAWVSGKYGSALSFDGVNDYVSLGSSSVFNFANGSSITLESWVKTNDSTTVANQTVVANRNSSTQANWYTRKSASNGNMGFTYRNSGDTAFHIYETDSAALTSNAWVHLAFTYTFGTGSSAKWYVNGQQVAASWTTGNGNEAPYTINGPAEIGSIQSGFNLFWNGLIDEVRIYNYARTAEEIRLDYNAGFAAHIGYTGATCATDPASCMTEGLVGYWPFEEGKGVIARDSSDYANNATTSGTAPSWTKGKVGGALSFDGVDDYVNAGSGSSLDITETITLEAWIYPKSTGEQGFGRILAKGGTTNGYEWYLRQTTQLMTFRNSSGIGSFDSTGAVSLNTWQHVVVIYDGQNVKFYINGIAAGSTAKTGAITTTALNLFIGEGSETPNRSFDGLIDEVRVYNRALSAGEVRYHYNRGGPVAQWKFDEGEGRTAYDSAEASTTASIDGVLKLVPSGNTATSTAWVAGKYGSALQFDGIDDFVDIGDVSGSARTISFWLKRGDTLDKDVIDLGTPEIKISSNAIISTGLTSPVYYIDGVRATAIADTNWHHIAIIDTADINASNVDIGKASTNFFNGLIDDVRIYNYARTPEEIRLDYNAGFAAKFGYTNAGCQQDPASCMTQGLVGYWGFEEGSGTTARDSSNYANNGTLTSGPLWTKGKVGGALNFDGVDDRIQVADSDSLDITNAITMEAWIKLTGNTSQYDYVIQKVSDLYSMYFTDTTNQLRIIFTTSNGFPGATISTALTLNTWYHIVGTYDTVNGARIYSNGVLADTGAALGTINTGTGVLWIGGQGALYNLPAILDEVRIYNRALSVEEVRYHYNKGGPVGYWKMDEGEGRTVYDSTDNNNDGTLVLAGSATSSAWVAGKYGSALSFDGADDYVQVADSASLDITNVITLEAWVKLGQISAAADQAIIAKFDDAVDGGRSYRLVFETTNKFYIDVSADASAASRRLFTTTNTFTSANTWYHVVATADVVSDDYKIYVNGASQPGTKTFSAISSIYTSTSNLTLGFHPIGTAPRWFKGLIDDVRIYNYARTPSQIRLDYNQGLSAHFR